MRDLVDEKHTTLVRPRPPARRRVRRKPILRALLACVLVAGLAGGLRYGVAGPAAAHVAAAGPFHVVLKGPGVLDAQRKATLAATQQGRLEAVPVDVGAAVTAGQAIARLDDDAERIDLERALRQVQATGHQIAEAKAQIERERAGLIRAERELARQRALSARGVVPEGGLDIAQADRDAAAARVTEARARADRLAAELAMAEQSVALARHMMAERVVPAPFDGVVISTAREVGDVVAPGGAILQIADPGSLVLAMRLDASRIARVAPGQSARVSFGSAAGRTHAATVRRINPEVDPETREVVVDLDLDAPPETWALGQRGTAAIRIETKAEAIAIPAAFVARRDGAFAAWVLTDGRAWWRPLTLGATTDGRIEVQGGLGAGETVLQARRIYPGMRVEIRP